MIRFIFSKHNPMKKLLLYLWQLPQNLLALILLLFYKEEKSLEYKGIKFHCCSKFKGGISLGGHAIIKKYPNNTHRWNTVKHEWGHTRQSLKWGWLYLVVIGIPSITCCWYSKHFHTKERGWTDEESNRWYFNLPWEKAADKYGGVER